MLAQEFFSGLVSGLLHSYGLIKDGPLKIMLGHFYCSFKKLLSFMAKSLTKNEVRVTESQVSFVSTVGWNGVAQSSMGPHVGGGGGMFLSVLLSL